jgi:2-polyprenyl-3-methyl-5-hydroxy-6-metoxy-1,4-benzoquinol methylase
MPPPLEVTTGASRLLRTCPVCERPQARPFVEKASLRLVRCEECAMIYANPVETKFASGEYYHRAGTEYYLSAAKLESDFAPVRFERELRIFRKYCGGGLVLDVGCSTGAFLHQLTQRFPDCYVAVGTDVSGPALDYAETRGVSVRRGSFLELDFGPTRFDAITFWAVLEHLVEPKRFLERAAKLLRPGGTCFVLVPNMESLAVRWLGARYRYIYPQHLNYFTRGTLAKLSQGSFVMLETRSSHFNPLVIWQDWRGGGAEVSNRKRGELLQRTTAYKQHRLLAPVRVVYRLVEGVLGKLNLADNLVAVLRSKET